MQSAMLRFGLIGVVLLLAVAAWTAALPAWVYGVAFFGAAAFYTNTLMERVPLYLTNRTTWAALSELVRAESSIAPVGGRRPAFVDLGCGVGGVVAHLARAYPDWNVVGVETAPGPYLIAKVRTLGLKNAQVRFQSLWRVDLGGFDVVYAFLSPAPMPRLLAKAQHEMNPESLFVSNSFWDDAAPFDGVAEVNDGRSSQLIFKKM